MNQERKIFIYSLFIPVTFLIFIWCVKLVEEASGLSFGNFGIYPRKWFGLIGLITAPLLHADFSHLISNSFPLLVLGTGLFYLYRKEAPFVFVTIYFVGNFIVWLIGRESYHIGASGVIYGLAAYLFFSGIFRKNQGLAAISLLVVFLYGSIIWGVLPGEADVSFEGHFSGFAVGIFMAFYYRNVGWVEVKEEEEEISKIEKLPVDFSQFSNTGNYSEIVYHFTENTKNKSKEQKRYE